MKNADFQPLSEECWFSALKWNLLIFQPLSKVCWFFRPSWSLTVFQVLSGLVIFQFTSETQWSLRYIFCPNSTLLVTCNNKLSLCYVRVAINIVPQSGSCKSIVCTFPSEHAMNMLSLIIHYVTPLHSTVLSISNTRLAAFITHSESCCCNHGSPLGVVIGLQNWGSPTGPTDASLFHTLQPGYRDQTLLRRRQSDRGVKLTTQLHLMPHLRISGAILPLPTILSYVHRDFILFNFTPDT